MSRLTLLSPAKLNVFLKVQDKRPDGFHNIVTVFERIDLADEISFRPIPGRDIRIICDHRDVPVGPKNLVYKAARLLQADFGSRQGAEIRIKKRIPVAAGLAGGSSNAATALMGFNRIWKLGLSRAQLMPYARNIGSDVAFFLHDASWALGTQRGDHIKKLNIPSRLWHILVVPRVKLYSWKVYKGFSFDELDSPLPLRCGMPTKNNQTKDDEARYKLQLTKINDDVNILVRNLKKGNVLEASRLFSNGLETEVFRLCPRLQALKERLKLLDSIGVMVSGSGPSVFGLTATEAQARSIKSFLSKRYSQVFAVKTL